MTSRDFCYWLQGYFEVAAAHDTPPVKPILGANQVDCIKKHLALVFKHEIDPGMGSVHHQQELIDIHNSPDLYKPLFDPRYDPVTEDQKRLLQEMVDKIPKSPGHFPGGGAKINC